MGKPKKDSAEAKNGRRELAFWSAISTWAHEPHKTAKTIRAVERTAKLLYGPKRKGANRGKA